jgi:hypothetical protein
MKANIDERENFIETLSSIAVLLLAHSGPHELTNLFQDAPKNTLFVVM